MAGLCSAVENAVGKESKLMVSKVLMLARILQATLKNLCWNLVETEWCERERMSRLRGSALAAQSQLAPCSILSWLEESSSFRRVIDKSFWVCWEMSITCARTRSSGRRQASPKLMESGGWGSSRDAAGRGGSKSWIWSLATGGRMQIIPAAGKAADVLGTCFHDCWGWQI